MVRAELGELLMRCVLVRRGEILGDIILSARLGPLWWFHRFRSDTIKLGDLVFAQRGEAPWVVACWPEAISRSTSHTDLAAAMMQVALTGAE